MEIACLSNVGKVREVNEDSSGCFALEYGYNLLIVADGMGGHNAGEVASKIAVKSITDYIKRNIKDNITSDGIIDIIKQSIENANSDIYEESIRDLSCSGMGTTVTAAMLCDDLMLIGHVGDSRAYILEDNKLRRVTSDHSLVAELVKNGTITEDEAMHHPQKNIITRALGTAESIEVDIGKISIKEGDMIMLCSDGLTNLLCDKEIEQILLECDSVEKCAEKMVDRANDEGGYDNITVIIAKVPPHDGEVIQ